MNRQPLNGHAATAERGTEELYAPPHPDDPGHPRRGHPLPHAAPAFAQPDARSSVSRPPPPATAPAATLADVAPAHHAVIRQRAMHFYRMPDGSIWDGWNNQEARKALDISLKPFDRFERSAGAPNQYIVEDRRLGTVWRIKPTRQAEAWALIAELNDESGDLYNRRFEIADRRRWRDAPPLWTAVGVNDYAWDFTLIDEDDPDAYTRKTHGAYIEITREWGENRYEVRGYSLDLGELAGLVYVPDPVRFVRKDRFKGRFFLWPLGQTDQPGGEARDSWVLIPADELRISPDELADALLGGRAEIAVWSFTKLKDKYVWKRTIRQIDPAPVPVERPAETRRAAPPMPDPGPDLVLLTDGRWFRGRITHKDEDKLILRTFIGRSEMDMTFPLAQVKEFHAPEKR